jgi:hypothetical protein
MQLDGFSTQFSHSLQLFVCSLFALNCVGDSHFALQSRYKMAACSEVIVYRAHNKFKGTI